MPFFLEPLPILAVQFVQIGQAAVMCAALAVPVLVVYFHQRTKRRIVEAWHAERMAAIERGQELPALPPDAFSSAGIATPGLNDWLRILSHLSLLAGLVSFFAGVGLQVARRILLGAAANLPSGEAADSIRRQAEQADAGVVVGMVGLAFILFYLLTRKAG